MQRESASTFEEYTRLIDDQNRHLCTLRGLLEIKTAEQPIPLEEVEPAKEIVKRFATGAMSFGSISRRGASETLALAMNSIGGRSNTGEGGEDEARYRGMAAALRSNRWPAGRFGMALPPTTWVNAETNCKIKNGAGCAKPGEGGQLPGHKVDDEVIARVRHSIPGVLA